MGNYVKKKKDMVFQTVDSLQQVVNVINEASAALNDTSRTIVLLGKVLFLKF